MITIAIRRENELERRMDQSCSMGRVYPWVGFSWVVLGPELSLRTGSGGLGPIVWPVWVILGGQ